MPTSENGNTSCKCLTEIPHSFVNHQSKDMNNQNTVVADVSTDLTADELAQKAANKASLAEGKKQIFAKNAIKCGRFEGAFKVFADKFYSEVKFYGIGPKIAHKVACDACSNLADAMSKDAELAAKVNKEKAKSDGETSFKLSGKSGLVKMSNAMILIRLTQQLEALRAEKLLCKPLKLTDLSEFLKEEVQDYLIGAAAWAERQEWTE